MKSKTKQQPLKAVAEAAIYPKPGRYKKYKSEKERKYSVITGRRAFASESESWLWRNGKLNDIFNFVAGNREHFVTLDQPPHADDYDDDLLRVAEFPADVSLLRTRYYWADQDLRGLRLTDQYKGEIRTERKAGKGHYTQIVKIGGNGSGRTLERGEYSEDLDGFGINLDIYPGKLRRNIKAVLGEGEKKPLVRLQGQSRPVLYHPDGRKHLCCVNDYFPSPMQSGRGEWRPHTSQASHGLMIRRALSLPAAILSDQGVGDNNHLAHDRRERDFRSFPPTDQISIGHSQGIGVPDGGDGTHIKRIAHVLAAAPDHAVSIFGSAVPV